MLYNFKAIGVVPKSNDFIDIVLSKTQRGTPTVVHKGWAITRIRQFYTRKVKFTQQNWHDRLTVILDDFPKVDDIHPFYGDLLNVLYDRDHYKLALGQLAVARSLIDRVASDYVRLLKYGDSLYRCKELKRAALGRMCTLMKRQGPSLKYLEEVRQHMGRLPAIDPATRTLLVCGYPNVGKSSFMNKVTRADVEVQPYAFTTKSLFVGHMDYRYLRWQVIDTPGILDRPLEERNTIEMQSITALAHLRTAVLYILDVSEQCGYTIQQQATLFHSISPLFASKPLLVVANKVDATSWDSLSAEDRATIEDMGVQAAKLSSGGLAGADDVTAQVMKMSALSEEGVMSVRSTACDRLLASRVDLKLKGKRVSDVTNRMHVALPKPRDNVSRPPVIPSSVITSQVGQRTSAKGRKLQRAIQEEKGGAGVYSMDDRELWTAVADDERRDVQPEMWSGHNIADFVDTDIEARLAALEQEEDAAEAAWAAQGLDGPDEDALEPEERATLTAIRLQKKKVLIAHRSKKSAGNNQALLPRRADPARTSTTSNMKASLERVGIDASAAVSRARERARSRVGRKRTRSEGGPATTESMDITAATPVTKRIHSSKSRSMSRGRALSVVKPMAGSGLKDAKQRNAAIKIADRMQRRAGKMARKGEGDRHIPDFKPKHLFSGKRGNGKTDRR